MENENKNNAGGKARKHKSYFITPNATQAQPKEAQAQADGVQNAEHSQRAHKHKSKPKAANSQANQEQVAVNTSTEQSAKASGEAKSKKNKNKHRKGLDNAQSIGNGGINAQRANSDTGSVSDELSENDFSFAKFDKLERATPKKLESFASSPEYQKYKDYEEFTYDQLYGSIDEAAEAPAEDADSTTKASKSVENSPRKATDDVNAEIVEEKADELIEVVGIRFKATGKTYYFLPNGINLRVGINAIVETARGLEFGEVVMSNSFIPESETVPPLRSVVRAATSADIAHNEEIKRLEESAFHICNEKIIAHKLDMKLIDAQYTFDNSKLLFYFTSAGRVDFRDLVKDLASVFRTRIELRQIGIRDEAKMVGGLGMCGRPLCCSKFLTDFGQVSIKMAKEQGLSLNAQKISGICGRLMCCLRYEHEAYEYETKRTPPVDTLVRTVDGVGTVIDISPLQGTIKVRLAATPDVAPKSYKREEVNILKKKN